MSRRWLVLVGLALLLVAAGAWRLLSPSRAPMPSPTAVTSPATLHWRAGALQQYHVQTNSSMQMKGTGATPALDVRLDCLLDLMTLQADAKTVLVGMRLSSVDLQIGGNGDPEANRALSVPFRVRYDPDGMPEAFEFSAGVTAQDRSILENLVRMFQVTMNKGDAWVAQEANGSGSYEAAYHRTAPSQIEKSKRHFSALPAASILTGAEIASTESFRLDGQHDWLTAMSVDETLRSKGGGGPSITVTNHATLELQPDAQVAAGAETWRFSAVAPPAADAPAKASRPEMSEQEARRAMQDVLTGLDAATEGRAAWVHRLRDLLLVSDAMPGVLLEALRTRQFSDRTRADIYLAFQLAGTPAAQAALNSVITDASWSWRDSMRAIVALGGVKTPTADSLATLWNTAESMPPKDQGERIMSAATYALGNLGSTMNDAQDPQYPSLRSRLLDGALSGSDVRQRTNFANALGNTQDPSLAREIAPLLKDPAPSVRRATAESLGVLGPDPVADQLLSRLKQEPTSAVRGAIAESLADWKTPTPGAMADIRAALPAEQDENTRFNMARFLGENMAQFPENRPVLQTLLRTEQSKRIRQTVANMLAAPGG